MEPVLKYFLRRLPCTSRHLHTVLHIVNYLTVQMKYVNVILGIIGQFWRCAHYVLIAAMYIRHLLSFQMID
jgi:hypothetical protein